MMKMILVLSLVLSPLAFLAPSASADENATEASVSRDSHAIPELILTVGNGEIEVYGILRPDTAVDMKTVRFKNMGVADADHDTAKYLVEEALKRKRIGADVELLIIRKMPSRRSL